MPVNRMVAEYNGAKVVICLKKADFEGFSRIGSMDKWKNAVRLLKSDMRPNDEGFIDLGRFARTYFIK